MSSEHEPLVEPFFPFSCHLPVSRRRLLAGAGVLLGMVVAGRGVARAGPGSGGTVIEEYATAPEDLWAVAHGIRAVGRDFRLRDGGLGVDHLLQHVLTTIPANGRSSLGFDPDTEAHPDAFLAEAFLEPGVALAHPFTHGGRRRTLGDVAEGARARFRRSQVSSVPNALPWSLIAFTRTTSPVRPRSSNAWGETVDLDVIVESALGLLEEASRPIAQATRERRPESVKAPVHSFTNGASDTARPARRRERRVNVVMDTMQVVVVVILACDRHAETIRRMLDEASIGSWIALSPDQARRAGHLTYQPLWPSTASHVVFGFADRAASERILTALREAVHAGGVCPTCVAFTWEGTQALIPSVASDPVCRGLADCSHAPKETYKATTYYFCSGYCRDCFVKDPERYVGRGT